MNSKKIFSALSNVIESVQSGSMNKDEATSIIEAAKTASGLLNYELKRYKVLKDLGSKDVDLREIED